MSEEAHENVNPTEDGGVVLSNPDIQGLGWLIGYCIYDGSVPYQELVGAISSGKQADETALYRSVTPLPRKGGSAFSRAVKSLETKQMMMVHDNPDLPLTNNKERMRIKVGGEYGYKVQWNIVTIRRNIEYALKRTRRGYVEGQPRVQVVEEPLYRVRVNFPSRKFPREWRHALVQSVWGRGDVTAVNPSTTELRKCVVVEPMAEGSMPNSARFMRLAQERLRDAFVQACTSVDDDLMRTFVRNQVVRWGGVLSSGSSGASYFVHDPDKKLRDRISGLASVIDTFADRGNDDMRAMWVQMNSPWWSNTEQSDESLWEQVPVASYRSTMTNLVYGSSEAQLRDIRRSYISGLQKAQQTYYQAVRKMVQDGTVDRERINELRKAVADEFSSAANVVGKEAMQEAVAGFNEYVPYLADRLTMVMSPEEEEREETATEAMELLGFDAMLDRL